MFFAELLNTQEKLNCYVKRRTNFTNSHRTIEVLNLIFLAPMRVYKILSSYFVLYNIKHTIINKKSALLATDKAISKTGNTCLAK